MSMWKRRALYCLGLVGAFLFLVFYTGWFSWFVIMMLILLPVISLAYTLPAVLRLRRGQARASIEAYADCFIARGGSGGLTVAGHGTLIDPPCWRARITVRSSITDEFEQHNVFLSGKEQALLELDTSHCAVLSCDFDRCAAIDPLGLFALPVRSPGCVQMLIAPQPVEPSPRPELSSFIHASYRPKPGGGYSEVHEFRDFRPGDSMRDVHWKLTAKLDELIVREPQIPLRITVILTCDIPATPGGMDRMLDRLSGMSEFLLENGIEHEIRWQSGETGAVRTVGMSCRADARRALPELLKSYRHGTTQPFVAGTPYMAWHRHFGAETEADR